MLAIARETGNGGDAGRVAGFLRFVPCYGSDPGYSLDLMRRRPDSANGLTEYLIANAALSLGASGVKRLSLNFAAWGRLLDESEGMRRRRPDPAADREGAQPVLPDPVPARLQPEVRPRVAAALDRHRGPRPTCSRSPSCTPRRGLPRRAARRPLPRPAGSRGRERRRDRRTRLSPDPGTFPAGGARSPATDLDSIAESPPHPREVESVVPAMRVLSLVVAIATAGVLAASASATPIADAGTPSIPTHQGGPVEANPIKHATKPEQNPFMAANPNSNIHNDTWMTDAYQPQGPARRTRRSTTARREAAALCGSLAFDSAGRIVSVCPSLFARRRRGSSTRTRWRRSPPRPARRPEPARARSRTRTSPAAATSSSTEGPDLGADEDRPHLRAREGADGQARARARLRPDRRPRHGPSGSPPRCRTSTGRIWFVSKQNGKVGTLDPKTGKSKVIRLGRGDRELVRGRRGRRLHRLRQADVPVQGDENGEAEDRLAGELPELRDRQAEPGRRRLRDDADDHGAAATWRSPTTPTR